MPAAHEAGRGAIGVFDSGIGGLTVVRELARALPGEPIVYLGDTARVPYGNKSRRTILQFSTENVLFLLHHDVKLIVVACHTATSYALPFLERHFKHPILGVIQPGVETALRWTRSGRIGVVGTQATVSSGAYLHAFGRIGPEVKVTQVACPLFVPLVEEGICDGPLAMQVAQRYLRPLMQAGVDTLILGCTHYPLLKRTIARVMGPGVRLVDSARQVALVTREALRRMGAAVPPAHSLRAYGSIEPEAGRRPGGPRDSSPPSRRFFVTDEPRHFERLSRRFLGRRAGGVSRVDVSKI